MSHDQPHTSSPRLGAGADSSSSQARPPMLRLASTSELEGGSASRMRSRSISSVRNSANNDDGHDNSRDGSSSIAHHHRGTSSAARLSRPEPVSRVTVAPVMGPASSHEFALNDPIRGPGTPDFTIQQPWRSSSKGKARASESSPPLTPRELGNPSKPRIGSQLRSFFSSIGGSSSSSSSSPADTEPAAGPSKARNSDEFKDVGRRAGTGQVQSLSASAFTLANEPQRVLVMPSARMGTPSGLALNDDSPPLTPSDETSTTPSFLGASSGAASHGWPSQYVPFSAASHSTSSAASDRASPVFSYHSNGSVGTISPPTRPGSSIPPSLQGGSSSSKVLHTELLPTSSRTATSGPRQTSTLSGTSPFRTLQRAVYRNLPVRGLRLSSLRAQTAKLPALAPHFPALLFLMICFVGSTVALLLGLSTLPIRLPAHKITELTMDEIRDACLSLREYSRSSLTASLHTLVVLCAFFTWKQAFNIPGSLIMNVVFGAMYGTVGGALYSSVFTAVGGVLCYLLVAPLGPLIAALPGLNKPLSVMRKALGPTAASRAHDPRRRHYGRNGGRRQFSLRRTWAAHTAGGPVRLSNLRQGATAVATDLAKAASDEFSSQSSLWSYLLVLRVLPVVPYGLMNIAASVLRVPLLPFAGTLLVGSIPWNAMTAQVGDLLIEVVQAFPGGPAGALASQLDEGGFSDAPFNAPLTLGAAAGAGLDAEKAKLANAARKAQGGMRAIAAKVWTREMLVKLVFLSILSLAPMLLTRWLKAKQSEGGEDDEVTALVAGEDDSIELFDAAAAAETAPSTASPRQPMATLALFEANLGSSPRKVRSDDMESLLLRDGTPAQDSFDVRPQSPITVEEHAAKRAAAATAAMEGLSRPSSRLSRAWGWTETRREGGGGAGEKGGVARSVSHRSPSAQIPTRKLRASVNESSLNRSQSARQHQHQHQPHSLSMSLSMGKAEQRFSHARQSTDHMDQGESDAESAFYEDAEEGASYYESSIAADADDDDDDDGYANDDENPYDAIVKLQDAARVA